MPYKFRDEARLEDIFALMKEFKEGEVIRIDPNKRYPDGYFCRVVSINQDGTIVLKLSEVWPCL